MRITGGKYCRRNVVCPPGVIRPAMDRMRESLFSILGDLSGLSFLDLFSGSGCVAIEAASRGAEPIHLVEMDRGKRETIEKNLSFVEEEKVELAKKIASREMLKDHGLFIIHYPEEEKKLWPEEIEGFSFKDERKYGRSMVRFYEVRR